MGQGICVRSPVAAKKGRHMAEVQLEPVKAVPAGTTSGFEFLAGIPGLFASQKGDAVEFLTDFEKQNRYALYPISADLPDPIPSDWIGTFKGSQGAPLLKAKEESECCERQFCGPFRGFTMAFVDGSSNTFFTLERPFKFDCCWNADCCVFNQQEIIIKNAAGEISGKAVQEKSCCNRFCSRAVTVYDASDQVLYVLESNDCGAARHNNCCAPTCCNETHLVADI